MVQFTHLRIAHTKISFYFGNPKSRGKICGVQRHAGRMWQRAAGDGRRETAGVRRHAGKSLLRMFGGGAQCRRQYGQEQAVGGEFRGIFCDAEKELKRPCSGVRRATRAESEPEFRPTVHCFFNVGNAPVSS